MLNQVFGFFSSKMINKEINDKLYYDGIENFLFQKQKDNYFFRYNDSVNSLCMKIKYNTLLLGLTDD